MIKRPLRPAVVSATFVLLLTASACGSPQPTAQSAAPSPVDALPTSAPPPSATSTATAAADATPAGVFSLQGTLPLKDSSGYTYELDYSGNSVNGFSADPTTAKPGQTNLTIPDSVASAKLLNTTPGRQAPGGLIFSFDVWGLYPKDSPACSASVAPQSGLRTASSTLVSSVSGQHYCAVQLTSTLFDQVDHLDIGGSTDMAPPMIEHQEIDGVPEADASTIIAALNHPVSFVTLMTDGENPNLSPDVASTLTIPGACKVTVLLDAGNTETAVTAVPLGGSSFCAPKA